MALSLFIVKVCRELRRNQTPEEKILWALLRNRKLRHLKFLRQHPFVIRGSGSRSEFVVVDFYCAEKKLVIELDGKIHEKFVEDDRERDEILDEMGLHILRIKNEELIDHMAVLNKILKASNSPPTSLRSVTPSLRSREGAGE